MIASDGATIDGVEVGRYLQTYSKKNFGPRFGFAYDVDGNGKNLLVRGGFGVFWNFSPGGTSSSKAQNPPFLQSTSLNADADRLRQQPAAQGRPAGAARRRSEPARRRRDAFDLRHRLPRRLRAAVEPQRPARAGHATTWPKSPTSGRRAGRWCSRWTSTRRRRSSASATRTSTGRSSGWRRRCARSASRRASAQLDYHGLLVKFQRRFANNFSFLNSYTYGKSMDYASDNEARSSPTPTISQYNRGPVRLRRPPHVLVELDLRAAVGRATRFYGGWQMSGILLPARRPAADRHADAGRAVDRHRQPAEPHLRRPPRQPDHRSLVRHVLLRAAPTDTTGTYGDSGRGIIRGPGSFNIDASLIKNTRIGRVQTEIRIEAFNLLNHPQFANPNTTDRQRRRRHDLGDAVEPVLLAVRHDRAAGAAGREGPLLGHGFHGTHGTGSSLHRRGSFVARAVFR